MRFQADDESDRLGDWDRERFDPEATTMTDDAKSRLLIWEHTMKNVEMVVEGNILTIKVDLARDFGPSSSGKTIIIASTEGNVPIPDREEKVGLNIYRKP